MPGPLFFCSRGRYQTCDLTIKALPPFTVNRHC
jgi:hypothetical protein